MIRALVGGFYGSEAKGAVAYHIRNEYDMHVRVGGPNAGHTIYHNGRKWAMQSVPCGWTNPEALLVLGAGAVIDPEQLLGEVTALEESGHNVLGRLVIDKNAAIITSWHKSEEGFIHGEAHRQIGSTGKGVGLARMSKLSRGAMGGPLGERAVVAGQALRGGPFDGCLQDRTRAVLQLAHLAGSKILLEGTQGWGLSLDHGPWPFVTSGNVGAAQLASDTGLPPQQVSCTVVFRTFPIRVAGNSGPFRGEETSWEALGVEPQSELTTVTKKVRRVAHWSDEEAHDAILSNGADSCALMCLDQRFPEVTGATLPSELSDEAVHYLADLEDRLSCPIWYVGTSPTTIINWHPGEHA